MFHHYPLTWMSSETGITAAVNSVTEDALRRVWDEFSYRVDVVRAASGGHIEHF